MRKIILTMAVVSAGVVISGVGASAQGIKEGQWSMSMATKMAGVSEESAEAMEAMENMSPEEKAMMQQMMGGMNIGVSGNAAGITTSITQCVSDQNPVPEMQRGENCKETHSLNGNTVNFEVVCDDSRSTGQVTYQEDSMQGLIKSQQMVDGKKTDVEIEITGQYEGPCS